MPTDIVPYLDSSFSGALNQITTLLQSSAGVAVPVTVDTGRFRGIIELEPEHELEPNTAYELSVHWLDDDGYAVDVATSFTTGDGPLGAAPPVPSASLQHYDSHSDALNSCGPALAGECIRFNTLDTVAVNEVGSSFLPTLVRGSLMTVLSDLGQPSSSCIELRTRAQNGALSEAQTLCGDDAELVEVETTENLSCTEEGLTLGGSPVEPGGVGGEASVEADPDPAPTARTQSESDDESGMQCSFAAPSQRKPLAAGWLLLCAAAWFARRR